MLLLLLGYNGKKIGYDVNMSADTGVSVEVITEWRNVKVTWNNVSSDGLMEATIGLYWDSARDLSKRILGISRVQMTALNSYAWTTTFKCPYLVKVGNVDSCLRVTYVRYNSDSHSTNAIYLTSKPNKGHINRSLVSYPWRLIPGTLPHPITSYRN